MRVFDLATQRQTGRAQLTPGLQPIALSEDGSRLLLQWKWKELRLYLYDLKAKKYLVGWRPYPNLENDQNTHGKMKTPVRWARFVDAERVATVNFSGILSLWKLPECQKEYEFNNIHPNIGYFPVFTTDGEAVFLPDGSLFHIAKGTILGKLSDFPSLNVRNCTISPDGTCLAAAILEQGNHYLRIWDLATGRKISNQVEDASRSAVRLWCAKNFILEPGAVLDVARGGYKNVFYLKDCLTGRFVWRYNNSSNVSPVMALGSVWLMLNADKGCTLLGLELPDPESLKVINQNTSALAQPVVGPGMSVALDLQIVGPAKDRDKYLQSVRTALLDRLKKGNLVLADNPQLTLRVTTSDGEEVSYGKGGSHVLSPFTVRALRCTLAWTNPQGQVLWKRDMDFSPQNVKTGANPAEAVREAMWELAKSYLSGDSLPVVVFPIVPAGQSQDRAIVVLGEAVISPSGEIRVSK